MTIGIDLGTTNSAVAFLCPDGPKLIPNALGRLLTPSVIAVDADGTLLVGQTAKDHQVLYPESAVGCFKRHMGSDWTVPLGGKTFTATQLSSLILSALKEDAQSHLNQTVQSAVITVPAYFHDGQRQATMEAGRMAGLKVERIINEPTAAAMAYGIHEKETDKTVAVFDLGGGTLDVSVVDFFEGCIEVKASAGEAILGGEDFTRAIARTVLADRSIVFETAEMKSPMMISRLVQQCEKAKRELSSVEEAALLIPDENGNLDPDGETTMLDRGLIERACKPLFSRITVPVRRALGDATLKPQDVDEVIIVGGATRMPCIASMVKDSFLKEPQCKLNPDHVVAMGAAVQAGLIDNNQAVDDMVVVDVSPFTLGVETSKKIGNQYRGGYMLPIINRNTVIPTSRTHSLLTVNNNQATMTLKIYQGESRRVDQNLFLGELSVKMPRGPAGQEVDLRLTYDSNGVLELEATVVKTKEMSSLVLTKNSKELTEVELKAALLEMQALKSHPREAAENRFVLKRAERAYQEVPQELRWDLERRIDYFEQALEAQDPSEIDAARLHLTNFLSAYDFYDEENDGEDNEGDENEGDGDEGDGDDHYA